MVFFTLATISLFLLIYLGFTLFIKLSVGFFYVFVWTKEERRKYCPNGLVHALFFE